MADKVRLEREGPVAIITIDNPPVNSLGMPVFDALKDILDVIEEDESVRAVVVTGAGEKAFVAGAEINEFEEMVGSREAVEHHLDYPRSVLHRLGSLPCPVIAAVQANAMGGGWELAMWCDLVVADDEARFGLPEVRLGTLPGGGGTQHLPRLVSPMIAKELMFLGRSIDANEAYRIGAVNRIAAHGEVLAEAKRFAEQLAEMPRVAVACIKRCVDLGSALPLDEGLVVEREEFVRTFESEDIVEGYKAFLEKRRPEFAHQ